MQTDQPRHGKYRAPETGVLVSSHNAQMITIFLTIGKGNFVLQHHHAYRFSTDRDPDIQV